MSEGEQPESEAPERELQGATVLIFQCTVNPWSINDTDLPDNEQSDCLMGYILALASKHLVGLCGGRCVSFMRVSTCMP